MSNAADLAQQYTDFAQALVEVEAGQLTTPQFEALEGLRQRALDISNQLLASAAAETLLSAANVKISLQAAIASIQGTLRVVADISKIISDAGIVIKVGEALASGDAVTIANALSTMHATPAAKGIA